MNRRLPTTELESADVHIAPPLPAPYLVDAPQLDDELSYAGLSDEELDSQPRLRQQMKMQLNRVAREIIERRQAYQTQHGVIIDPEDPTTPD